MPYDNPGGVVYDTGNCTDPRRFTDAIWNKAQAIGLPLDLITAESDTPQFEFTLTCDDAVAHIDTVVLVRQMAREVPLVIGECGGNLSCATCHVQVDAAWVARVGGPSDFDDAMLDATEAARTDTSRLSCQIKMTAVLDGIVLHVPGV